MVAPEAGVSEAFDAFVAEARREMPTAELADQVAAGLGKRFANPPCALVQSVLPRGDESSEWTADEVRRLIFSPDAKDASLYAELLRGGGAGGDDDPLTKSQIVFLGPVYLVHQKRWPFVRPFILAGGLESLVGMFTHSNLHLRGQALEVFRALTSEHVFPWHGDEEESGKDGGAPGAASVAAADKDSAAVLRKMYELAEVGIVPQLMANYGSPFPSASHLALSIFAFYVSWLRKRFCRDNILRLSRELLDRLRAWGGRNDASPEERDLATRLFDDFSRFGPAEARMAAASRAGRNDDNDDDDDDFGLAYEVREDRTLINHVGSAEEAHEAQDLKRQGNAAYAARDYSKAIALYSAAIDVRVAAHELVNEGPRRATYHANRAAAYLARAKAMQSSSPDEGVGVGGSGNEIGGDATMDAAGHLEGADQSGGGGVALNYEAAIMDCDQALDLESGHVKARFRKAQALAGLGRREEALAQAESALSGAPEGLEREIAAFVARLRAGGAAGAEGRQAAPRPASSNLIEEIVQGAPEAERWHAHVPGGPDSKVWHAGPPE